MTGFGLSGVALVTGAGSGIGAATAVTFIQEGVSQVVLADLNEAGLANTVRLCLQANPDAQCLSVRLDVRDENSVKEMMRSAVERFGRVDYAVNSAGVTNKSLVGDYRTEEFNFVMDVNFKGVFNCMREQLAQMAKQEAGSSLDPSRPGQRGSIVNVCSINSFVGAKRNAAYVSSKHAVLGLTKTCAIDYAAEGVRCNGIAPGYIATPITQSPQNIETLIKSTKPEKTPAGRPGVPNEIADVIVFLSSPRASFVNGACWVADGGFLTL